MKCRICPREISTERRQLQPRSVTCSPECSIEHTKAIRSASAARCMRRKRSAAGATELPPVPASGT